MLAGGTQADLEVAYNERGAALVACDVARQLAVDTHAEEHKAEDKWAAARDYRQRPKWKLWVKKPT